MYEIFYTKASTKDISKLKAVHLDKITRNLIEVLRNNPYQNPPPYEKLVGNLKDLFSRRINRQHRLVYRVMEEEKKVIIVSMWSNYEF